MKGDALRTLKEFWFLCLRGPGRGFLFWVFAGFECYKGYQGLKGS